MSRSIAYKHNNEERPEKKSTFKLGVWNFGIGTVPQKTHSNEENLKTLRKIILEKNGNLKKNVLIKKYTNLPPNEA